MKADCDVSLGCLGMESSVVSRIFVNFIEFYKATFDLVNFILLLLFLVFCLHLFFPSTVSRSDLSYFFLSFEIEIHIIDIEPI